LPRALTIALGKDWVFAEGRSHSPRQRNLGKKKICVPSLPRAAREALGKEFFKNKSTHFLCRGPLVESLPKGFTVVLGKEFFEKNSAQFLYRGLAVEALGKDSIPRNDAPEGHIGPRQRLCRVPDKRPSAKAQKRARPVVMHVSIYNDMAIRL